MHFVKRVTVAQDVSNLWDWFWNNVDEVAKCVPGCTDFEEVYPQQQYKALIQQRLGPLNTHFNLEIEVGDTQPKKRATFLIVGKDQRLASTVKLPMCIELEKEGKNSLVTFTLEPEVTGRLEKVPQQIMEFKFHNVVDQFVSNIESKLPAESELIQEGWIELIWLRLKSWYEFVANLARKFLSASL